MTTEHAAGGPPHRRDRPTPVRRTVPVVRIEQLTPHIRRVTFGGTPAMEGFSVGGPAENMKIYFPQPGHHVPIAPDFNAPPVEGQPRPLGRTYTPRAWRPEALELDIDFVLHGEGAGSEWALAAEPGSIVTLSTPKGAYAVDPAASRFVIAGDSAALPAIGTILETLPPSARAEVYVEVEGPAEEVALSTTAAGLGLTWLHRGNNAPCVLLDAALRDVRAFDADTRVFVACEAAVMRDVKMHLLFERGIERGQLYTHGYWKQGVTNHPDGDRGEDV